MERPNLIYVFADQLRYDACGYTGNAKAKTPNIDALSREGVSLINAVSGHPVCAPYRASLFTGKYTTSTGMVINEIRMNPNHVCFAHVLTQSGYKTAYIGKWHLWANELGNHYDPKNSYVPPGPYRLGFDGFWATYNFHHEYYKGYYHTDSLVKIPIEGYEPDGQTDMAINLIREYALSQSPFALFLSYGTPHDPWSLDNVPEEYYKMFKDVKFTLPPNYKEEDDPYADQWGRLSPWERKELTEWMKVYYAMVANLDWNIGRLLKTIDESGLRDNTIFIFTSDHGEMFGSHGRRAKNIF
ncbi:MAG TPA: sulfatase-like hydrolase/transferase, partial [bacterium]|nr:sulfatase-like hydrolase/transferase [bacterium]